jgi:hypothetical protein
MKRYTINDILNWHPCERYTAKSLKDLMGRRKKYGMQTGATICLSESM